MVAVASGYAWYHFSGAKTLVKTARKTEDYFKSAQQKLKESTPEPNEALNWLRQTAQSYAAVIPGASAYVNTAFDDLDTIRAKHGGEVDQIVREAYNELKDVSQKGLNVQTAQQAWDVMQKHIKRIMDLAGDAAGDILNNHPELKERVGGNVDQLKQLGDKYGPEAKKQVNETWDQIRDIMNNGINSDTANKIRNLVQEKTEQVKKLGDEAWQRGIEQAKPYLDKNPKLKQLVEENSDALKSGNFQELYGKIKQAVESGNTGDIENYIKNATSKAKQSGMGALDRYLGMIPGGDQIMPKLTQLSEVAQKHGSEAEKLMKETVEEIKQVLTKKADQAQKLAEKAEKESKK